MVKTATESSPASGREVAWRTLRWASAAILFLQLVDAAGNVRDMPPHLRAGAALFSFGWVTLIAILVYGVWKQARWALWVGGILAGVSVVLLPVSTLGVLQVGSVEIGTSPLESLFAWLQTAANAAFLVGLVLLRRARE
ncbi:MAG TPA: hypothetical protein VFU47_14820 [Armatimonadota bacterium]|nr:hypothetical protein [Armatimonadota bacterium]